MAHRNGSDDAMLAPLLAVFAGLPGAGKTTVIEQLKGETDFPPHLVTDLSDERDKTDDAVQSAIALNHSLAVESRFDSPLVLEWMNRAAERGYCVELVIIGVDDDDLLLERKHARRRSKRELEAAVRRMSAGVDIARRVMMIDNSSGLPFVAATIDKGAVQILDQRPAWLARRILAPRLARQASMCAIRKAYDTIARSAAVRPILQMAGAAADSYTGKVVARSQYHVLQQVGEALHVIHDVGLLDGSGAALVIDAVVTLAYGEAERSASAQPDLQHERGPER